MKFVMTALVSAFLLVTMPSLAGSHGGGKMDDKKVDCSKKKTKPIQLASRSNFSC
jgi:hypothetical protein